MATDIQKHIKVIISDDAMEAQMDLSTSPLTDDDEPVVLFKEEDVFIALKNNGISYGIDHNKLYSVLKNHEYNKYFTVAVGTPPHNGEDGYFTYNFKTEIDNKPKVLPDGSVDYRSVDIYEPVKEGDVVATYTSATFGKNGYTVKGAPLHATNGKELKPLKGQGFEYNPETKEYISKVSGKIELNKDTLTITNLLEIRDDVDITSGNVNFTGDVIIHGNVLTGSQIRVDGNLTIMGNVEGAYIYCGGDIQLKSGMQGADKGIIECKHDVWGKFFEHTTIRTKGDVHANSILGCNVFSEKNIYVTGRHGIIVGGSTICQGNLEATVIGNMAEVKTNISVGLNQSILQEIKDLEISIANQNKALKKHFEIITKLNSLKNAADADKISVMKKQVNASIRNISEQLEAEKKILADKLEVMTASSVSKIKVNKYLYPLVLIRINGLQYATSSTLTNVTIKAGTDGQVNIINNI